MASIKPVRPEPYEGKRDGMVVNTWLYQLQVYFSLVNVSNNGEELNDEVKINLATSLMKGNAASWWFMKVQSGLVPQLWDEFMECVRHEFVPQDQVRRNRDKLRTLYQKGSVSAYLNLFRNIVISIPNITEDEKLDKFCSGLKPEIKLEVLKAGPISMDAAARIALNVDSAMYSTGNFLQNGPVPMDIGNVNGSKSNLNSVGEINNSQRDNDRKNNACFICHKQGCRPWKCNKQNYGSEKVSDSEN